MSTGYGWEGLRQVCATLHAWCAPCTERHCGGSVYLGRYNKCSTFTLLLSNTGIYRATMKACWTSLVVCWLAVLAGVHTEMFTAIIDMKRTLAAEHDVARLLKSYIKNQQSHLISLAQYVTSSWLRDQSHELDP